jgi:uncharacterized membrane protein
MNREEIASDLFQKTFGGPRNVGWAEGLASIGIGLGLAAGGLQKADARGAIMGLLGAYLVTRGMTHHCPVKAMIEGGSNAQIAGREGSRREMAARY